MPSNMELPAFNQNGDNIKDAFVGLRQIRNAKMQFYPNNLVHTVFLLYFYNC